MADTEKKTAAGKTQTQITEERTTQTEVRENAWNSLESTWEGDWSKTSSGESVFGVDKASVKEDTVGDTILTTLQIPTSTDAKNVKNTWNTLITGSSDTEGSIASYGNSIYNAWTGENVLDDEEGWSQVGDAAASAALTYLNEKLSKIKSSWTTTKSVTIGDIVGEIAPYAINWRDAGTLLMGRMSNLLTYITTLGNEDSGDWGDVSDYWREEVNSAISAMLDDPSIASAVSNLKIVNAMATTLSSVSSMIDNVSSLLKSIEPYLPMVEIIADLALSFFSGGCSATKATQKLSEYMATLIQELSVKVFEILRRTVFSIKISMPSILVGALGTLKLNESQTLTEGNAETQKNISTSVSNLLSGRAYTNITTARQNNSYTHKLYTKTKNILSYTSTAAKTYSNTLASGNLLSSFEIGENWDLSNWTDSVSNVVNPMSKLIQQYSNEWKTTKEFGYTSASVRACMAGYVLEARKEAGLIIGGTYTTGNEDSSSLKNASNTVLKEEDDDLWDEISVQKDSKTCLEMTSFNLKCI